MLLMTFDTCSRRDARNLRPGRFLHGASNRKEPPDRPEKPHDQQPKEQATQSTKRRYKLGNEEQSEKDQEQNCQEYHQRIHPRDAGRWYLQGAQGSSKAREFLGTIVGASSLHSFAPTLSLAPLHGMGLVRVGSLRFVPTSPI